MKLQDQVCTLEQAKRLHELGIAQKGYYCHAHIVANTKQVFNGEMTEWEAEYSDDTELTETSLAQFDGLPHVAAFTVAELGVMLPYRMRDEEKRENPHLRIYRGENEWHVEYHQVFSRPYIRSYAYENLSDAMAHVLIHLLENKLITPEEVNARLCAE